MRFGPTALPLRATRDDGIASLAALRDDAAGPLMHSHLVAPRYWRIGPASIGLLVLFATVAGLAANIDLYQVESDSMRPTLQAGDYLVVRTHACRVQRHKPSHYGQIVLADWHLNGLGPSVKRVVGVGGDRIRIRAGTLFRNGREVGEPYVSYPSAVARAADVWPAVGGADEAAVPAGHLFLMGDNRAVSLDARNLGTLPETQVVGIVEWHLSLIDF